MKTYIAKQLNIPESKVTAVLKLLADGATIPFIARYRKEVTGNLDEVQLAEISTLKEKFTEFNKRKETILKSLIERDLLTDKLQAQIDACHELTELEDLYLPLRPKKKTKASTAKEKGLEPLAKELLAQHNSHIDFKKYINRSKEVHNRDEALAGARDIIAEIVSEDSQVRQGLRIQFTEHSTIQSKLIKTKKEEADKFRDYFDHSERLSRIPAHRFLAIMRGVNEKLLRVSAKPDQDRAIRLIERIYIKSFSFPSKQVKEAIADSYKRLLAPSLENEVLKLTKDKADNEAIEVFIKNLKELLMAAPLGDKSVLAFDPGFRTGAKVVALDKKGNLLEYKNLFVLEGNKVDSATKDIQRMIQKYSIEVIAIGNGTAGRETEQFIKEMNTGLTVVMVDENGASIYSASETARKEFPDLDLTVRGAVSIGRRLQDPLAELVKIDAKSIGVGQYQHDVDQNQLKKGLDQQVISCVNAVGVTLNNASAELLSYVSGLGPKLAEATVIYRQQHGPFKTRQELLKVPRLGAKVFEQAAGFLRILDGKNPLDASAVHPESYGIVKSMAKKLNCSVEELLSSKEKRQEIVSESFVSPTAGKETIEDILAELDKPGRDPRSEFKVFSFDDSVHKVDDLYPGMKLPGIVTNVTNFGAFIDIGVHQDGLVHISKLTNGFVSDPSQVVRVKQQVEVTVMEVDSKRKRISLSMID
ncbi:MAG: RNA-binding transcriptional accessory protein [Lentisphaeraceae bacterium]|nr:RNA-binding transcriptional accessory protein [Lentisphaeraceae bacterium]